MQIDHATRLLGAIVVLALAPTDRAANTQAVAVIDGAVTDTNLVALGDATASILGSTVHVVTGANGRFRMVGVGAGDYILVIHRIGYVPSSTSVTIGERDTLRLSFSLRPIVNALDTVVIKSARLSGRMTEFDARRNNGNGHFMTQDQIEAHNSVYVSDLLRTIMSVRIESKRGLEMAYNRRDLGQCPYQIYVDGIMITPPVNLQLLPSPHELAGIEVYSGGATLPLLFKNTVRSFCGAILLWTRDG